MQGMGMLAYAPPRPSYGDAPYLIPNAAPSDAQTAGQLPAYQGGALPIVNSPFFGRSAGNNPFGL